MSRASFAARAGLSVGVATLLTFTPAFALGPFEKNAPQVEAGMKAYDQGKYEDALKHFDAAKAQAKDSPALEFDRGNALYKLKRYEDAQKAYQNVADAQPGSLSSKDYYNLGNAWAALKKKPEAVTAYRRALTLDPNDEQARHNLEVLLTDTKPTPPKSSPDGGTDGGTDGGQPDAGHDGGTPDGGHDGGSDAGSDGGRDAGADGGQSDGGQSDGGADAGQDGGVGDAGSDAGTDGGSGKGQGGDAGSDAGTDGGDSQNGDDGQADGGMDAGVDAGSSSADENPDQADGGSDSEAPDQLSKKDAERLLDAMKQNEKNLQLWRFQQHKRQRKPNEKDW